MHANSAIRTLIREGKTHQFDSLINQAGREGMRTMDGSIFDLLRNGVIDQETALTYCTNPETMRRNIQ